LTRPYGWASLVAQHWLHEGDDAVELEGLPGHWSVRHEQVIYTPRAGRPNLSVDGRYPEASVEIVPGRNMVYSNGDSVPVYFGTCEVDTVVRTNDAGSKVFAVRVRDPREAARKDISYLDAFEYDPGWRVPASFEPLTTLDIEASTVETGVRETTSVVGRLIFELDGQQFTPLVIGKEAASGIQPVLQIRDASSGKSTYGAGRVVDLEFAGDTLGRIDYVDFNYLAALPCAFTNFVTCPIAPPENYIPIEISAGEKKPVEMVDRVSTYAA
ncbi:MAG: DUF1684 domain-containing protein, partial [Nocardioidaceae bacterium]|nr:DUF1684 domain-containing protein [Nocardioidaceae bacterium]